MIFYILNIVLGIIIFALGIYIINRFYKKLPYNHVNGAFLLIITTFYFVNILLSIAPANGLNLMNCTPLSNISPFLFTMSFIALFLPQNLKKKVFSLFSIFFIAMFFAPIFTNIFAIIQRGPFFAFSTADTLAHIFFSLFCFYLLRTNQISLKKKDFIISCFSIYGVAVIALLLNLILKTSLFGLNFYGNHNIYGLILTNNGFISAVIYFSGLTIVIFMGNVIRNFIIKKQN